MHRGGFDHCVFIEVVADLGARDFHHLVDEHVVVAARKVHQVAETAHCKEQILFVGKAGRARHNGVSPAESGGFHGGVAQGFEFLVQVRHGAAAVILFRALHNANAVVKAACHGGNPTLARNAVGVHGQKHFVLSNLESAF